MTSVKGVYGVVSLDLPSESDCGISKLPAGRRDYLALKSRWSWPMIERLKQKILSLLDGHRTMRIATVRPDGWPQTTSVGCANDGLTLYFLGGKESQKAVKLASNDRVSLAIDDDPAQVMQIKGLSMAAHARRVMDDHEAAKALGLILGSYPEQEGLTLTLPSPADVTIFRGEAVLISVLDYSLGFGHTDFVSCDREAHAG